MKTVVVVGHGMVGHRFVESLRRRDTGDAWRVVVLAEETRAAYDRVALSSYVGDASARGGRAGGRRAGRGVPHARRPPVRPAQRRPLLGRLRALPRHRRGPRRVAVVASPLHKQHFALESGTALEDPGVVVATYPVRVVNGTVEVGRG